MIDIQDIEQDHIIKHLVGGITSGRLHHAYILSGSSGVGKEEIAWYFAQTLLCQEPDNGPCGRCVACEKFSRELHPDLYQVEPEEDRKKVRIGQVREIYTYIKYSPVISSRKVCIIRDTDSFDPPVANALLKLLEEPPPFFHFILLSSNYNMQLPTIVSRCQVIKIKELSAQVIARILEKKYNVKKEKARFLSVIANGRIKDALAYTESDIIDQRQAVVSSCAAALLTRNFIDIFCFCDQLAETRSKDKKKVYENVATFLVFFIRDIYMFKRSGLTEYIINIDRVDDIRNIAELYTTEQLESFFNNSMQTAWKLGRNLNPNLVFDTVFMSRV